MKRILKRALKVVQMSLITVGLTIWGFFVFAIIQSETQSTLTALAIVFNVAFLIFIFCFVLHEFRELHSRILEVDTRIDKLILQLIEDNTNERIS